MLQEEDDDRDGDDSDGDDVVDGREESESETCFFSKIYQNLTKKKFFRINTFYFVLCFFALFFLNFMRLIK